MNGPDRPWLQHLSSDDLAFLVGRSRGSPDISQVRRDPILVDRMLGDERVCDALFGDREGDHSFVVASPFLVFAVAVSRSAKELLNRPYVDEWAGPGQRLPVFGAKELSGYLEDPARRYFLAALLASYTHVSSGSVWVSTPRGPRRRRYSELDPLRLAALLDVVPEHAHQGIYRRLGDLSLFLTGVFPDHTAGRSFRPLDVSRLARAVGAAGSSAADELAEALEIRGAVGLLETLGRRWYRLASRGGDGPSLEALAEQFPVARRALNHVTDAYLFPYRGELFPAGSR